VTLDLIHTFKAEMHLSAAILLFAKCASTSLPSTASPKISKLFGLVAFSVTKYRIETMAKNVVYIENQQEPASRPRFRISVEMCTTLREILTHADAHANALWSTLFWYDLDT